MNSKLLLLTAVLALGAAACGDFERGEPATESTDGNPPGPVTDGTNNGGGTSGFDAVHTTLTNSCGQCHGGGGKGNYKLSDSADTDYDGVRALVDTGTPENSSLLQKGAGQAHGGGAVWAPGDADYELVLAWIQNGANR